MSNQEDLEEDFPNFSPGLSPPGHSVPECHVCGERTQKARVHYGGVSCYSCRAFFRRATTKKKKDVCRRDNLCEVKYDERKRCGACRYTECLRVGMKPHLVLSEDEKQARFKNVKKRNSTEISPRPSLEALSDQVTHNSERAKYQILGNRHGSPMKSEIPHRFEDGYTEDSGFNTSPSVSELNARCIIQHPNIPLHPLSTMKEEVFPAATDSAVPHQVARSPAKPWQEYQQHPVLIRTNSYQNMEVCNRQRTQSSSDQMYSSEISVQGYQPGSVRHASSFNSIYLPEKQGEEEIKYHQYDIIPENDSYGEKISGPSSSTHAPANMIGERRSVIMRCLTSDEEKDQIVEEERDIEQPLDLSSFYRTEENTSTRKYVQLNHHLGFTPIRIPSLSKSREQTSETDYFAKKVGETNEYSVIEAVGNTNNLTDEIILNALTGIDMQEIENLCSMAEQNYQKMFSKKLDNKWNEINCGPLLMRKFLDWSVAGGELSADFFQLANKQLKERCIRMICVTDEFNNLECRDQFTILQSNLDLTETLTYVRSFNCTTDEEEKDNVFGETDKEIWAIYKDKVPSKRLSEMTPSIPFNSSSSRQRFLELMSRCKLPIITDKNVFYLFVAILFFSPTSSHMMDRKKVQDAGINFLNMLRQYLKQIHEADIDIKMGEIMSLISDIKQIAQIMRTSKLSLEAFREEQVVEK